MHVRYLRELRDGDPVRVTFQLLDYDSKRMHYFEQLFHAEEGWVVGHLREHVAACRHDRQEDRAVSDDFITARLARMKAAHAHLPVPEGVGRRIAMPGKG